MGDVRGLLFRVYKMWSRLRPAKLTVGVRALVFDEEDRICLVRHSYRDGWYLPGGNVKTGESLVDAMQRVKRGNRCGTSRNSAVSSWRVFVV